MVEVLPHSSILQTRVEHVVEWQLILQLVNYSLEIVSSIV